MIRERKTRRNYWSPEKNNQVSKTINMKLPKLEIKMFSGYPKELFGKSLSIYPKLSSVTNQVGIHFSPYQFTQNYIKITQLQYFL